eukprot:3576869-Pleurochrysis_carterae.AAC.2
MSWQSCSAADYLQTLGLTFVVLYTSQSAPTSGYAQELHGSCISKSSRNKRGMRSMAPRGVWLSLGMQATAATYLAMSCDTLRTRGRTTTRLHTYQCVVDIPVGTL